MDCCAATANPSITLFWWSFFAYSTAILIYIVYLVSERKQAATAATAAMAAAFLLQTAAIISRGIHLHRIPLTNMFEYITLLAWFAGLCYFIFLKVYRLPVLGVFIAPVVFMLMVAGSLLPKEMEMQLMPALQSYWLQIHVSLAAFGESVFAIAFAANIMYFIKKKTEPGSRLHKLLPEEETLDRVSYKAITAGYPLFTIGALFAGAIWAEQAWGSFWSWDPKEVGSLVVWLVYTAYLHARLVKGWSGTRAAVLSILGFICSLLTFFANMFLGGLHAYA